MMTGRVIADALASAGADVAISARKHDSAERAAKVVSETTGRRTLGLAVDVTVPNDVDELMDVVLGALGRIDILVNNAGVNIRGPIEELSEADWDTVINVHLKGAFLMTRAVQKYMVAAKWGRIVNLSSLSAVGNRGQVNYAAAKAGLQGFTKTLAVELGKYGITANAVAPGFVATDMTAATAARIGVSFDDFKAIARFSKYGTSTRWRIVVGRGART